MSKTIAMIPPTTRDRARTRRGVLFRIHMTAGLVLAAYMLIVSVSGAALLYRPELQQWISPDLFPTDASQSTATIGDAAAAIADAYPELPLVGIGAPTPERAAYLGYVFDAADGTYRAVLASVETGAVLGSPPESSIVLWLQDLHFNLLAGTIGHVANGIGALALLVMSGTGWFLWWPGRPGLRGIRSAHGAAGAAVSVWLIIWGVTGAYFVFPAPFRSAVLAISPVRPPAVANSNGDGSYRAAPDLDRLVARAEQEGGTVSRISLPTEDTGTIQVVVNRGGPTPWEGDRHVYFEFDRYTGDLLARRPLAGRATGERVLQWFGRLHMGGFGGGIVRVVWAVAALSLAGLALSGGWMWWTRRRTRPTPGPGASGSREA